MAKVSRGQSTRIEAMRNANILKLNLVGGVIVYGVGVYLMIEWSLFAGACVTIIGLYAYCRAYAILQMTRLLPVFIASWYFITGLGWRYKMHLPLLGTTTFRVLGHVISATTIDRGFGGPVGLLWVFVLTAAAVNPIFGVRRQWG